MRRAKIEYHIRVKVLTTAGGKASVAAEASEPVQIMPIFSWWQERQSNVPSRSSPLYESINTPRPSISGSNRIVHQEKTLKKGVLGKKKGVVSVSIEAPESYVINVGEKESGVALCMPISLRYSPISADLPLKVRTLSARLHANTKYNVDSRHQSHLARTWSTNVTILKTSTPSTSTPLWLEDSTSEKLAFVANMLMPMNLPPAAGSSVEKGATVLLPSFETCMISRSYDVEVKIGFEGGSDVVIRVPTSIVAKPATSVAETQFESAIIAADNWSPPEQEVLAGIESELLRPTAQNLNTDDIRPLDQEETGEATPPDYQLLVAADKLGAQNQHVTGVAATVYI